MRQITGAVAAKTTAAKAKQWTYSHSLICLGMRRRGVAFTRPPMASSRLRLHGPIKAIRAKRRRVHEDSRVRGKDVRGHGQPRRQIRRTFQNDGNAGGSVHFHLKTAGGKFHRLVQQETGCRPAEVERVRLPFQVETPPGNAAGIQDRKIFAGREKLGIASRDSFGLFAAAFRFSTSPRRVPLCAVFYG